MVVVVVMLVTPVLLSETEELVGCRVAAVAAAAAEDEADDDTDDEADNEEVEEGVLVVVGGVNCSRPTGNLLLKLFVLFSPSVAAVAVVVDDEILVIELVADVELTDTASSFTPATIEAVVFAAPAPVIPPLIGSDEVPLKLCCC